MVTLTPSHTMTGAELFSSRKYISLFTGAGGLDIGLDAAGFTTVLCVEKDKRCRETLELNGWPIASKSALEDYSSPQDLLDEAGVLPEELDLIAGGPPCQPFSKSGYWRTGSSKRMKDPRAQTLVDMMDLVKVARPAVVLIENVKGMTYAGKTDALDFIRSRFEEINEAHNTSYKFPRALSILNSMNYGVPQRRERLFLVISRDGLDFAPPEFTHGTTEQVEELGLEPFRTAWDAIGEMDITEEAASALKVTSKHASWLPSIPEGQNYLFHTPRGGGANKWGWRTRYWSFLLKLAKVQPSWTITAKPGPGTGPFHWDNRRLSISEIAALQTFPDSYMFKGSYREQHRQVGNAVPCVMGELMGLEIRRQIFAEDVPAVLSLVPPARETPPPCPTVEGLPSEAGDLGDELPQAHPGEGLGPGRTQEQREEDAD